LIKGEAREAKTSKQLNEEKCLRDACVRHLRKPSVLRTKYPAMPRETEDEQRIHI
jgi:hypothetical protein